MTLDQYVTKTVATTPDAHAAFAGFLQHARSQQHVLAVVLSGSQARDGMARAESDYDAYVILDQDAPAALIDLDGFRSARLDLSVMTLTRFRTYALPDDPASWDAYAFVGAKIACDRTGGEIGALVAAKATLTEEHARQRVAQYLDAYTNFTYRSLKNHRDGRLFQARLDAAEAIPCLLTVLFALHRRIRPYNKYLLWELENRPLGGRTCWSAQVIQSQLERLRIDADPATQSGMFTEIERTARDQGHDAMLDAWGDDLRFLRTAPTP